MSGENKNAMKPDDYWRETLNDEQYRVCRQQVLKRLLAVLYYTTVILAYTIVLAVQRHFFILKASMIQAVDGLVLMHRSIKKPFDF